MRQEFEKQLLQSQVEVQEATYASLGKELHDNVGQLLSTAKMLIGITERKLEQPPETLTIANETIGKAINELRSLSKTLTKEWLEQFNLIENLTAEVARINPGNTINLHLSHPDKIDMIVDEQLILFRMIQEAVQNAIKHSEGQNIYIAIEYKNSVLQTTIRDDGHGFSPESMVTGVGLLNMKQRAKLLNGNIEWLRENDETNVLISIPLNRAEQ